MEKIEAMPRQLVVGQPQPGKNSRFVRVDTNKMTAWVDKQGGRISRVVFNDYKVRNGKEDIGFFGMDERSYLDTQAGITGDENLVFSTASNQVRISEGKSRVVLQATSTKRVRYTKEFEFSSDGYEVNLRSSAQNGANEPVSLSSYYVISGDKVTPIGSSVPKPNELSFDQQAEDVVSAVKGYSGVSYTTKKKPNVRVKFAEMEQGLLIQPVEGGWLSKTPLHCCLGFRQ